MPLPCSALVRLSAKTVLATFPPACPESLPLLPLLPVSQEEVKSVTGSRFSREAFVVDLQSKVEAAAKEKADAELQTRLLSEELSDAGEENKRLEEVVKGLRELVQAAELSAGSLKQQVAEARSEADVQERRYAVRPAAAGGLGWCRGLVAGLHWCPCCCLVVLHLRQCRR
jgi:hypothetical protein